MCGIFGCVGKLAKDNAYKCIKKIAHRGPDALMVKELEGVVLAHARLSILDTSDIANQPMSDKSGRYQIVYNGEIYNFLELRKELESLGYHFKTKGDTEVLLYSYIEWGVNFQKKCNGMWSLAIWDSVEKKLFLSRDRLGVKPLYYYKQDSNFYFASEMKAFFPVMKQRRINYDVFEMGDYFAYESTENCCIQDIKKIPAGFCAEYKNGNFALYRWWNTLDNLIDVPNRYEEQVEMLRGLFLDACKIRMRSDVPIGTALSGGVDSSAVIGLINDISQSDEKYINRDWRHVFVASMPGTSIDETQYAEKAAKYVGLDIHKIIVDSQFYSDKLLQYMYICEEPYITSPAIFMRTYQTISDNGIKVTIDGHGADELFGGYLIDSLYAASDVRDKPLIMKELWETYNCNMPLAEEQMTYEQYSYKVKMLSKKGVNGKLDSFNNALYLETHETTLPTLLRCYDRYSMGNGVEIRMPFLDYRIVSFAFSIPWRSKINGGYCKKIIRDMAAPYMDKDIIYRKSKIGFNSPMTEWLHESNTKEFILDMIHSKEFYECELINSLDVFIRVNEFYKQEADTFAAGQEVWILLLPFLWKKAMQL